MYMYAYNCIAVCQNDLQNTFCFYRSHFVFIAKEGSKHICYLFSESEVDTATISDAVQHLMS